MTEYLFSYGTLQEDSVQVELFGRLLHGSEDVLKGYKTSSIEIKDESFHSEVEQDHYLVAAISDNEKDTIKGTVFEVSEKELLLTDKYEPAEYKRVKVGLGSRKQAWAYVAV